MPIYFLSGNSISGDSVKIDGKNFHHLAHVCRYKVGEEILVSDSNKTYTVKIQAIRRDHIEARITGERSVELKQELTFIQCLPKGRKMDLIIRQIAELGTRHIIPVISERTVSKLDEDKKKKLLFRWQKIAKEASQQAGCEVPPVVEKIRDFSKVLSGLSAYDLLIIPWEEEKYRKIRDILPLRNPEPKKIAIVIGPEGGLTRNEIVQAEKKGAITVSLGKTIFRTETAALIAGALIKYELGWL